MRKKGIYLVILLACLLGLIAVYFAVSGSGADTAAETTADSSLRIFTNYQSEITSLSVAYNGASYTFACGGGTWSTPYNPDMRPDGEKLDSLAGDIASVTAIRLVSENAAGSGEYGLDTPLLDITVGFTDGHTETYHFGDYSENASGYYFNVEGEGDVFIVSASLYSGFIVTPEELAEVDALPTVYTDEVTSVSYSSAAGVRSFAKQSTTDSDTGETTTVYVLTNEAGMTAEYTEEVGTDTVDGLAAMSFSDIADYKASAAELSSYGFDSAFTVTVYYGEGEGAGSFTVYGASVTENDGSVSRYVRIDGSDMVFKYDLYSMLSPIV